MAYSPTVIADFNKALAAKGISPTSKVAKSLFEAGLVESGLQNLDYGDADSLGALQQRPSQGWAHATSPYLGAIDYLNQAIPLSGKYGSAGELAQAVQRSKYPGRYAAVGAQAASILGGLPAPKTSSAAAPVPAGSSTGGTATGAAPSSSASVAQPQVGDFSSLLASLGATQQQPARQFAGLTPPSFAAAAPFAQGSQPGILGSSVPQAPAQDQTQNALGLVAALAPQIPATGSTSPATASTAVSGAANVPTAPAAPKAAGGAHGSGVLELIHNDGSGPGFGIKNGQTVNGSQVFSAVWAGHQNHVHVAAGPKTVVALGDLAQQMGLKVSENPHFGGVTAGAHVPDSYHYKGQAIDASGTPKQMDAFAKAVVAYNKTHLLPS